MRMRFIIVTLLLILSVLRIQGQVDLDPPVSPVLELVSVDHSTGNITISWSPSPSPDVSGYVVYLFKNNEGYELDTIYDPSATSYLRTESGSSYYSESFVVAALDTAGNISPLSNFLNSIYATAQIDTCNKRIEIIWNSYSSWPEQVLSYSMYSSVDGGSFTETMQITSDKTSLLLVDFSVDAQYCFIIKANLSGGGYSGSNKTCLQTKMQKPPEWINADYATVREDKAIQVAFSVDPSTEVKTFILERRIGTAGSFQNRGTWTYLSDYVIDNEADISEVNYYRVYALNNCNIPLVYSNLASNIVLSLLRNEDEVILRWNPYRMWLGEIAGYKIYVNPGTGFYEFASLGTEDSTYIIDYADLMYEATTKEICFKVMAYEASNPYGINSESTSSIVCTPVTELITVPNLFSPDNNSVNDLFRPVLSFTPLFYKLVITDLKRKAVFETLNYDEEWDGIKNGNPLPEGVYLWFLNVRTPSGKDIVRSGTVTIMHNR